MKTDFKYGDEVIIQDRDKVIIGVVEDTYNHGMALCIQGSDGRDFEASKAILVSSEEDSE